MSDKNKKYIRIRGANEHNLKNISPWIFQEMSWWF